MREGLSRVRKTELETQRWRALLEREQQVMERLQNGAESLLPEEQLGLLAELEALRAVEPGQAAAEVGVEAESEQLAEVQRELQEWPE